MRGKVRKRERERERKRKGKKVLEGDRQNYIQSETEAITVLIKITPNL